MTKTEESLQTEWTIKCPFAYTCDWNNIDKDICRYAYESCNNYKKMMHGDVPFYEKLGSEGQTARTVFRGKLKGDKK